MLAKAGDGELSNIYREVTLADIDESGFVTDASRLVPDAAPLPRSRRIARLREGDLLLTCKGSLQSLGKVGIVTQCGDNWLPSQTFYLIRTECIDPIWLFHYLRSPRALNYLRSNISGTSIPQIRVADIAALPIPIPNEEMLASVHAVHRQALKLLQKIDKLRDELDGLLVEKIANIAHEAGIPLIVDNTFATPYLVRPIEYGADIVVHSATKFIGGHGTTIGGVIIDSGKFDWTQNDKWPWLVEPNVSYHGVSFAKDCAPAAFATYIRAILLRDTGATISPVHSFIFLQGLETLSLRVERHVENALKVVQYLKDQPLVEKVNHPSISEDKEQQELYKKYFPNGGGSIFTFEIKGGAKEAQKFIDNLELFSLLANVADVKSLAIHPASTTHSECNEAELLDQGIKPNTIRLSIGTENVDDIIEDLDEAFKALAE